MAREENDAYPTPGYVAEAFSRAALEIVPDPSWIIEPSAGSGVFVREAKKLWQGTPVLAVEIVEAHRTSLESCADYTYIEPFEDWIVRATFPEKVLVLGNPPFFKAEEHISLCLDYLPPGSFIALLLKQNFFGSKARAQAFWPRRQLRYFRPCETRPTFKKGKKGSTDTNEYGLFVWEVGYTGRPEILFPHITWERPRAQPRRAISPSVRAPLPAPSLAGTSVG